jgi:hypothetical protein
VVCRLDGDGTKLPSLATFAFDFVVRLLNEFTVKLEDYQEGQNKFHNYGIHSFIPLAYAECDDSLPFSGVSPIPLCYILFPATFLHQLFLHPPSLHLTIYFLVYLLVLFFPNSYTILFWEF